VSNHEAHNRAFWDADADDYQSTHGALLDAQPEAWGVWRIPEAEVGALGDVDGADVLEYGCGAAQWSLALARRGARCVGLDQSRAQVRHAVEHRRADQSGSVVFVLGAGEHVPLADASFDVVFCDHGVMSFCDPAATLPEVARLLRPGGRFAFCHSTPWGHVTYDERRDRFTRRLRRPYFGLRTVVWPEGTADFVLPTGEWVRAFRAAGLVIDDLVELRAPKRARTTYGWDPAWARQWPGEHLWVLHKPPD
jgi:SAM-dependent methyltransferase